jgi:hypothetical protein
MTQDVASAVVIHLTKKRVFIMSGVYIRRSLGAVAGGGTDLHLSSHTAFRVEADWIGTRFFSNNQRHFQMVTGLVFNF